MTLDQYQGTSTPPYEGPDCPMDPSATSLTVRFRAPPPGAPVNRSPRTMKSHLSYRLWRLAVTVGPIIAIALTLVAGRRWG
jgi:hypothetical protein